MRRVSSQRDRLITETLGRAPRAAVAVDEGYDFEVVIVDGDWVFRFPRHRPATEALGVEIALLPVLAGDLPVGIPSFEHVSTEPPFVAYRLIRGEPLVDEDPAGVRVFLDAVHGFDASAVVALDRSDWIESYRAQCAEFERLVFPRLERRLRLRGERLFEEVESLDGFGSVLVHADLGPGHLLVRDGRLVGVIDWADARIGDPALDYAWLLNGPFADWDVDPELRRRARFYHRLAPWYEAHYGLFTRRPAHFERGLAGIVERL